MRDIFDIMKKRLNSIVSERKTQEEKGYQITVKAYKNNDLAQMVHGSDMARENHEKLLNSNLGTNSCNQVLGLDNLGR